MKTTIAVCLFVFAVCAVSVFAQEPSKAAPGIYKTIFENDRVRVHEVTIKAGEKVPSHSHPDHFAYAKGDCKLTMTNADGKVVEAALKSGEVAWIAAVTHSAVNSGSTDCHVLVVDVKEPTATKK